jgi:hypothetical protein
MKIPILALMLLASAADCIKKNSTPEYGGGVVLLHPGGFVARLHQHQFRCCCSPPTFQLNPEHQPPFQSRLNGFLRASLPLWFDRHGTTIGMIRN